MRALLPPSSADGVPDLEPVVAGLEALGWDVTGDQPPDLVFAVPSEVRAARAEHPHAVLVVLLPPGSPFDAVRDEADDAMLWPRPAGDRRGGRDESLAARLRVLTRWATRAANARAATNATAERSRSIAAAACEGIVVHDATHILYANDSLGEMLGYPPARLEGSPFTDFASAEQVASAAEQFADGRQRAEVEFTRADGTPLPVELTIRPGTWEGRDVTIVTLRDLRQQRAREAEDERKEASHRAALAEQLRAIEESNARFRAVARATNDALYDWDIQTGAIVWNDALHTVLRYTGDAEAAGIQWWMAQVHPDDSDRVAASLDKAMSGGAEGWSDNYRFSTPDGGELHIIDRGVFIRDASGRAVRMIGAMMDVTGRKQLQTRLVLADRLAGVGTMAAGVAHELNNPLTWVLANVRLVQESMADALPEPARRALDNAARGAERMRSIVADLKVFSRNEVHAAPVDLRQVLGSALSIVAGDLRAKAQLEQVDTTSGPLHVLANEARVAQVLLNLLVNAVQAIEPGHPERNRVSIHLGHPGGNLRVVAIDVDDTGAGIPPAVRARIFDPFFTTKPPGEGTGLGLSIGLQLVQEMGGEIQVVPRAGRGTRFRVTLPLTDVRPAGGRLHTPPAPTRSAVPARVLIVDDEAMIVEMLEQVLSPEFEVIGESDSRRALARIESGERFDAMLCDVMMPGVDGMELYTATLSIAPEQAARFVFVTGGVSNPDVHAFLEDTGRVCVEKPFDLHGLRATVRKLVGAR